VEEFIRVHSACLRFVHPFQSLVCSEWSFSHMRDVALNQKLWNEESLLFILLSVSLMYSKTTLRVIFKSGRNYVFFLTCSSLFCPASLQVITDDVMIYLFSLLSVSLS